MIDKIMKTLFVFIVFVACACCATAADINLKTGGKMEVFHPDADKACGRAIIICPGGGYSSLSTENEGTSWAEYFNELGYVVAVLKYRLPEWGYDSRPLEDAQAAVLLIRSRSEMWNIKNGCVGVMGFSAGGHVASTLATHAAEGAEPDFQILFYPVITMDPSYTHIGSHDCLLGRTPTNESQLLAYQEKELFYSNEKHVTETTPPAFITYATDDSTVPIANSKNYYAALVEHEVPAYIKEYPSGGHGFGWYKASFAYHDDLLNELTTWLNSLDELLPDGISLPQVTKNADDASSGNMIYTLDGRPVGNSAKSLPHGIYVCGGKKICVK